MAEAGEVRRRLYNVYQKILLVTMYIAGALLLVMMLSICYEVVVRYFFNRPTAWAIDFAGYIQYAITLIGATWVLWIDGHPRIDILTEHASPKTQTIIRIVTSFLAMVACAIFLWKGMEATLNAFERGDFLYRNIKVPVGPLYALLPFAFLLLVVEFGRQIYVKWRTL